MNLLIPLIRFELWLLIGGLALVVTYKMLTGGINMSGLLDDKATRALSPERVQLLVFTVIGAGYYLLLAMETASSARLPDIPEEVVLLLGGSHFVYLGGKSWSHFFPKSRETANGS